MTNAKHVDVLRQGKEAIRAWRAENPRVLFDLRKADLRGTALRGADLHEANLRQADLRGINLIGANLREADLRQADLRDTDLMGADLREADLIRANLRGADLTGSNLRGADLIGASLRGADLSNAVCTFTVLDDVDLSSVKGLETVRHFGTSLIGVDTLYRSHGRIPEVFLRGCGVPESLITYLPALTCPESFVPFHSCFVTFCHEDGSFGHRLYDAMQGRGIRCWLDKRRILSDGDTWEQAERGIRFWDKVLLCASKDSLTSTWVDDEIEHAFAKEKELFATRDEEVLALVVLDLDGYIFDRWKHPRRDQLLKRRVADFNGWAASNAKFDYELERVVQALRPRDESHQAPRLATVP